MGGKMSEPGRLERQKNMKSVIWFLIVFSVSGVVSPQPPSEGGAVDVQDYAISVQIEPERSFIKGEVRVRLLALEDTRILPFQMSNRLTLIEVRDERDVRYESSFERFDSSRMRIRAQDLIRSGEERTLILRFDGVLEPEQYAYFDTRSSEKAVISADGAVLLSEGNWFPAHNLPLDAATVSVQVNVPLGYSVVAPGQLEAIETSGVSEVFKWRSDRVVTGVPVLVSRYFREHFEGDVPLTFFVNEDYQGDLAAVAEEVRKVLSFFKDEYGASPVRWLSFAQVDDFHLPSAGSAGLVLVNASLLDAEVLRRFELASRLAQQWWGFSVRPKSAGDAWLRDGFANYAALRYIESTQSERFMAELARQAVQALKYEEMGPISRGLEFGLGTGQFESVVASKGAWVLYMLGQLIGRDKFHALLGEWYRKQADQEASTAAFAKLVAEKTEKDYRWFFVHWVDSVGVPEFRTDYTVYKMKDGSFKVRGRIRQDLELFRMPVDITIETKGEPEEKNILINGKSTSFTFDTQTMPLRLKLDPMGKVLGDSDQMKVSVHVALGEEFQQKGELAEAIREFERAKGLYPRSSIANYRLGEVFFTQQSLSSAANSFRDALNGDLKPDWVETWTHIYLGKIFDVLGERQRAMAEYQKAVNSKIDYNGAQSEAKKYLESPYSKPSSIIGEILHQGPATT